MEDRGSSQNPEKEPLPNSSGEITIGHPKESIEEASLSVKIDLPKDSVHVSHEEYRKTFKVRVSGELAKGLWYLLGFVVFVHLLATIAFCWRLTNKPDPEENEEKRTARIEKAISNVNDTSKTLYAMLGVLTTAVSGYYFTSGAASTSAENDGEK